MEAGRKHISSVLRAVHSLIQQWTPSVFYTHRVTKSTLVVLAVNTLIQQWPVLHSTPDWLQHNVECRPEAPSPLLFRLYPPWAICDSAHPVTGQTALLKEASLLLHTGSSRQSSFFIFPYPVIYSKCWLVELAPSPVHDMLWLDAALSVQMLLHCQWGVAAAAFQAPLYIFCYWCFIYSLSAAVSLCPCNMVCFSVWSVCVF